MKKLQLMISVFCTATIAYSGQIAPSRKINSPDSEFERCYADWGKVCAKKPVHSKSTHYVNTPEFRALVALGRPIIPKLKTKIEKDFLMDDILAFAVIEIMKWDIEEFDQTSVTKLREQVLQRLKN